MTDLDTLTQQFVTHENNDNQRHGDNLKRFEKQEKATLAIHKRMGDLATKNDLSKAADDRRTDTDKIQKSIDDIPDIVRGILSQTFQEKGKKIYFYITGVAVIIGALTVIFGGFKMLLGWLGFSLLKP